MNYFSLRVVLDYTYSLGDLQPYFNGLENGVAIATRCPTCKRTCFPPRMICERDGSKTNWYQLDGTGTIVALTEQASGEMFALVKMDGADNRVLARVETAGLKEDDRVEIMVRQSSSEHPANLIGFKTIGSGSD